MNKLIEKFLVIVPLKNGLKGIFDRFRLFKLPL